MTLEEKLTVLLVAICPRTFPDIAPTDTPRPYVIWHQIGGQAINFIDNTLPSKENAEIQIGVWSDSRAEAKAKIKEIEAALTASTGFQARAIAASASDADPDTGRRCARQDWSIWADR